MARDSPGILALLLSRSGALPAVEVRERRPMQPGHIYVAKVDHHLIVEPGGVCATRGPRENRFRPAIDPLFRSAAQVYGPRAVGVILTGGLDDGTAGLWALKQLGGVAVVQDPKDALADSMPLNALAHVRADHVVPVAEIPGLLVRLVTEDILEKGGYTVPEPMDIEVRIAKEEGGLESGVEKLGEPSKFACPECHGVLLKLQEGGRIRYRCHTGHAYSLETLLADYDEAIENGGWNTVRAMQEKAILLRDGAMRALEAGDDAAADRLQEQLRDTLRRAELVRNAVPHGLRKAAEGE
jgi:two-component system chemotaxis response regulator CheB